MKKMALLSSGFVVLFGILYSSFITVNAQNTTIVYYKEKYIDRDGVSHKTSESTIQECTFSGNWLSLVLTTPVRSNSLKYKFHHKENGYMFYYLWCCVRPFSEEHKYDY